MKALEWSQHLSNYMSMGIFPDPQTQLALESIVRSCLILNPSMKIWPCLLRMKQILSKIKAVEWSQNCFFSVTYKNEEDPSKDEGTRVVTFPPF